MLSRRHVVTGLPLAAVGLQSGLLSSPVIAQEKDSITIAAPADVPSWDAIANGSGVATPLHKCIYDMVISMKPDLTPGPSVTQGYRWLDDKGMVLELTLRDGVTFHNGDPLTSADIRFTFFERIRAEKGLMIAGVWGSKVDNIETPAPNKAVFRFNSPYVSAPALLGSIPAYILPKAYFEKVGRETFLEKPVGSGPYKVVDYQRDSRIVFEAYDKYWGGPVPIKRVTVQVIKDTSARIAAIQSGQVDFANNLPVREVVRLNDMPNLSGLVWPINTVVFIHMVNKGIFQDRNLRLAMHHAIDKNAISRAFFAGKARPLTMWAAEGAAYDPNFKMEYNPALAREYLAKSGYGPDKPVKIPIGGFNGQFPSDFDMGRAIVGMWKQVGIDADLQIIDIAKYFEMARNNRLEMPVLYSWGNATTDPELFSGLILDPKKPFSVWKSDDVSPKLDPLLVEVDEPKRMAGYKAFDAWAVGEGYSIPLLQSTATVVHNKRIKFVQFNNGWALPYTWTL